MTDEQFFAWLRRQDKEASYAKERRYYGDPAKHVKLTVEGERKMQVIRKLDEVFQEKELPVDAILRVWSDWMCLRDSGTSETFANPCDVRELMNIGEAVDTMIGDLKRHQWWAIRKSRGFCSVWIFKDQHYEQHLEQAREILEKKMRAHVATRKYFN